MKKRISLLLAGTAVGLLVVGGAGPASAVHCTDLGGPGHSDFAAHVQSATHKEGAQHRGWSTCQPTSANYHR
jgi:hypothetical protein